MTNIAIFASGSGTNFEAIYQAIADGVLDATIALVVVDRMDAKVIEKARSKQIETLVIHPKDFNSKDEFEEKIVSACKKRQVEWIVLAGYMRICSTVLLEAYPNRIINIHPSLLPAFKGKNAIAQAINYGVKVMGVSIHYVNQELDGGAIIAQKAFEVKAGMSVHEIECLVHDIEHVLYPKTLQKLIGGKG